MSKPTTRKLTETALLLAAATVLSMIQIEMPFGGGLTLCSMLPLVIVSHRYGTKWGVFSAFVYAVLQLLLGLNNVRYGNSAVMVLGIVFLDYIIAYTVLGLSAVFDGTVKNRRAAVAAGIVFSFFLRFLCHFFSGLWIWETLWPNGFGMASAVYSAVYNGWYMGAETVLTVAVAMAIFKPLHSYFEPETA